MLTFGIFVVTLVGIWVGAGELADGRTVVGTVVCCLAAAFAVEASWILGLAR